MSRLSSQEVKDLREKLAGYANSARDEIKKLAKGNQPTTQDGINSLVAFAEKLNNDSLAPYKTLSNNKRASDNDTRNRVVIQLFETKVRELAPESAPGNAAAAPGGNDGPLEPATTPRLGPESADKNLGASADESADNQAKLRERLGRMAARASEIADGAQENPEGSFREARALLVSAQEVAERLDSAKLEDGQNLTTVLKADQLAEYYVNKPPSGSAYTRVPSKKSPRRRARSNAGSLSGSSKPAPPSSPLRLSAAAQGIVVMSASESIQSADRQGAIAAFRHKVLYEAGLAPDRPTPFRASSAQGAESWSQWIRWRQRQR